jgi:hypothetical protein
MQITLYTVVQAWRIVHFTLNTIVVVLSECMQCLSHHQGIAEARVDLVMISHNTQTSIPQTVIG